MYVIYIYVCHNSSAVMSLRLASGSIYIVSVLKIKT